MKTAAPATKEQRELVRLLYLEHGHQKASELSQVPYDTVRQWAHRYQWNVHSAPVTNVTRRIADAVQNELAENERETRLSLSRYARRAAKDSEAMSARESPYVKGVAQVASITHKWGENDKASNQFTLNVLNINSIELDSDKEQRLE